MSEFVEVMRQDARMRRTEVPTVFLYRMGDLLSTDPARFEKAVMRWAKLHPERNMKDVFFEKFPKAKRDPDYGTPLRLCPSDFGWSDFSEDCSGRDCIECWNRPAPEE